MASFSRVPFSSNLSLAFPNEATFIWDTQRMFSHPLQRTSQNTAQYRHFSSAAKAADKQAQHRQIADEPGEGRNLPRVTRDRSFALPQASQVTSGISLQLRI